MRLRLGLLPLALLIAAAVASPVLAAPDKTATLNAKTPEFKFDGTGSGVSDPAGGLPFVFEIAEEDYPLGCSAPAAHDCDYILLNVETQADLNVAIDIAGHQGVTVPDPSGIFGDTSVGYPDVDVYPYKSDATGAMLGDPLTTDAATAAAHEEFTLPAAAPGYYLLEVEYFLGANMSFSGAAKITNFASTPDPEPETSATPAPESTPAPQATPAPAPQSQPQSQPAPAPQSQPAAQPTPAPQTASKPSTSAAAKKKAAAKKCKAKSKKIKNKKKRAKALKRCAKLTR